jgi:hypothetical protein
MKRKVSVGVLGTLLIAAGITVSSAVHEIERDLPNLYPTVDLSAVVLIECTNPRHDKEAPYWTGSGALIAKDTILTAKHVAVGKDCYSVGSGAKLKMYWSDSAHDMALMTGKEPTVPYIKYSCQPYVKGQTYLAYGISDYHYPNVLFRMNVVKAEKPEDQTLGDGTVDKHIWTLHGAIVPGMSGGPIVDLNGYIHGVVNIGQQDDFGLPTLYSGSYTLADTPLCKH